MTKSDKIKLINMTIVLFFIFGFRYVPAVGGITPVGMHVIGIFIGCIYGWSMINMMWPSLFAILSMSTVEGYTLASVAAAGFGSTTFWIIFFILLYIAVFEKFEGTKFLAAWFLTRKSTKGHPMILIFMFLLGAYVVGKLSGIASCLLFYTILYGICAQVGYKPHDKFSTLMIFGITFSAMFGSISLAISSTPLILANAFRSATGIPITIADTFKVCFIFGIFLVAAYTLAMKYVFRCDFGPLKNVNIEEILGENALEMNKGLKIMFGFTAAIILWIVGGLVLPAEWGLTKLMKAWDLLGITMILIGLLMAIKVDGKPMFTISEYITKVPWEIQFLCATILPMGSMLTMQSTGISALITNTVGNFLIGLPDIAFIAVMLLIVTILTNIGNNASMVMLMLPVLLTVCEATGLAPVPIYLMIMYAAHLAMLTPGACPYAALVWGNSEWLTPKEIYKYSSIIMLIFWVLIVVVGYPWAKLMLGV
ncbi:MAG: SLC13 family permease [Peptococcaceae bacterium]|nr:SLC13 family permease [Peptococcaceae bacterium]